MSATPGAIVLRRAVAADERRLDRLAQLDSARVPAAPALVAEAGGRLLAAVSLCDGAEIADPFRPTQATLELLRLRARQLPGLSEAGPGPAKLQECPRATRSTAPLAA